MVQREIFLRTGIKFVTIYVRSTLHDKTEFLQERYVSSIMQAVLSRYHVVNLYYPMQSLMPSCSCRSQELR